MTTIFRSLAWSLATAAILVLPAGAAMARTKAIVEVTEYRVGHATEAQVGKAVQAALDGRHWVIVSSAPKEIVAKLDVRDHSITTRITWTTELVSVAYVSSENMDYSSGEGGTRIDRYYVRWLKLLFKDIGTFLARDGVERPAQAPGPESDDVPAASGRAPTADTSPASPAASGQH